ncbi:hypothetical protein HMPREF9141_1436 [Prevotella multiformis DSM 16608]|uniref:Uncharacterized protein n=1 Tax=Prevotella multiformis DSM 16608 TaxID=888743 RepID=F0F769_9BACT|nr:hypothetical protein HMPREF9141_1436 [Prevotella multiformis DSM 16608]
MYAVAPYMIKRPAGIRRTFGKGAAFIAPAQRPPSGREKNGKRENQ